MGAGDGAVKVSPEQAERTVWIVRTDEGTANYPNEEYMKTTDGKKSFTLIELQDSYQLRAFLGKSRAILVPMYNRAIKTEETEDAIRMLKGKQPIEDAVYTHFEELEENLEDNYDAYQCQTRHQYDLL